MFFTQKILKGRDFCVCVCTSKIADMFDSHRLVIDVEAHSDYELVNYVHPETLIALFNGTLTLLAGTSFNMNSFLSVRL
jgi:hypothetical protein